MKPIRKRACCLVPMLIGAALFLFVLVLIIRDWNSETVDSEVEEMNHSVKQYLYSAETLDAYLQKAFPDDCGDKALTRAVLQVWFAGQDVTAQELSMQYYKYIDERREGGNIAVVTFTIDPIKGEITRIVREQGSGKSLINAYSEPISQRVIALPLTLYVENIGELVDVETNPPTRLLLEIAYWSVRVSVFTDALQKGYTYCERMYEWTPGTPFVEREYELKEHAWGKAESTASPSPD